MRSTPAKSIHHLPAAGTYLFGVSNGEFPLGRVFPQHSCPLPSLHQDILKVEEWEGEGRGSGRGGKVRERRGEEKEGEGRGGDREG